MDGEEAATLSGEYVQASCLVTTGTESMSFGAGEAAASFHSPINRKLHRSTTGTATGIVGGFALAMCCHFAFRPSLGC